MCFLVGKLPDGSRFRYEVAAGRTTVGRFSLSTIRLEEESISPLHAELIALDERRYLVRDLHSQHGIAVDGREVFEEEITAPCQLTFGRLTCDLQLEAPAEEAGEHPAQKATPRGKESRDEPSRKESFKSIRPPVSAPRNKGRTSSGDGAQPGVAPLQITLPKVVRPPKAASNKVKSSPVSVVQTATERSPAPVEVPPSAPSRSQRNRRMILVAAILLIGTTTALVVQNRRSQDQPAAQTKPPEASQPAVAHKGFLANIPPTPPKVNVAANGTPAPTPQPVAPASSLPAPTPSASLATATPVPEPARVEPTPALGVAPETSAAPLAATSPAPELSKANPSPESNPAAEPLPPDPAMESVPLQPALPAITSNAPAPALAPEMPTPTPTPEAPAPSPASPEAPATVPLAGNEVAPNPLEIPLPPSGRDSTPVPVMEMATLDRTQPAVPLITVAGELASSTPTPERAVSAEAQPLVPPATPTPSSEPAPASPASRGQWSFATPARHPRWDASAGALLASNDWKLSARQMMEAGPSPDDPSSRVASWYFSSSQPEDTGDLAHLTTRPSIPKPAPPVPAPITPEKVSVMILGDSLALCGFGNRLDQLFRAAPNVRSTNTYMACGTVPMSWLKEGPFTNLKTYCGFWSIEQPGASGKKPQTFQDTYGMGRGKPKAHPVPKLEDLFARAQPEILVLQTGTNLFSLFQDGKTVIPARHGPMLRAQIQPFVAKLLKQPHPPRAIYWVASPTSGRISPEVQDFVFEQVQAQVGDLATVIDSRTLVSYPYKHPEPDKEHFIGEEMDQWADGVYAIVQKDLSTKGLPKALKQPTFLTEEKAKSTGSAANSEPELKLMARLVERSEPLKLDHTYGESTVAYLYEVEKVEKGTYAEKQILVMHPAHIANKLQPDLKKLQVGKSYPLRLRDFTSSSWCLEKPSDNIGLIDLQPYIRVEDEARHPTKKP